MNVTPLKMRAKTRDYATLNDGGEHGVQSRQQTEQHGPPLTG